MELGELLKITVCECVSVRNVGSWYFLIGVFLDWNEGSMSSSSRTSGFDRLRLRFMDIRVQILVKDKMQ